MKSTITRIFAAAVLTLVSWLLLAAASVSKGPVLQPDKLVIISTTDVKGKTGPCG
jgi:hypothetical protein